MARVGAAFRLSRWITLTGPPGAGKSHVARLVASAEQDCVWVDARGCTDRSDALARMLAMLGAELAPGESYERALARVLSEDTRLIVLDNVSTQLHGLGRALNDVLGMTGQFRLLVTCVESAGLPDERVVRVGPFPLPRLQGPFTGPAVTLLNAS